jgi:hypothetical protein
MKIRIDFDGSPNELVPSLGVLGQWHRVPEANSKDLDPLRNKTRLFSYPHYCE